MIRRWRWAILLSALIVSVGAWPAMVAGAAGENPGGPNHTRNACVESGVAQAHCYALLRTDIAPNPFQPAARANATGGPYGPADLQAAYNLTGTSATAGGSRTVAIVDAYDDPNAETDLGVYRSHYGLTQCTTANGCFTKVNQAGGTSYPSANSGWAQEISLDLDMVSAICPNCHILLVEANSSSLADLGNAVNYAAGVAGVAAISNSYGAGEFLGETPTYESYYNHPGIAVTVSAGDSGYGAEFPAASRYVVAVGGTSLTRSSTARGWNETVWSGTGAGCSRYVAKPSWQHDTACANRTIGDVAAVADPNTGVNVYDSYGGTGGWVVFGGTSVSSPIVASVYALAGNTGANPLAPMSQAGQLYPSSSNTPSLYDVTSGSDGNCGRRTTQLYLCHGERGYDGPTGNGTPNGASAF